MVRRTHKELEKIALSKPKVKKIYEALKPEYALLEELIKARIKSGKTQEEVAAAMETSTSVVGRLETGGGKSQHSPTLVTLQRYAKALGYILHLKLIPLKKHDMGGG